MIEEVEKRWAWSVVVLRRAHDVGVARKQLFGESLQSWGSLALGVRKVGLLEHGEIFLERVYQYDLVATARQLSY